MWVAFATGVGFGFLAGFVSGAMILGYVVVKELRGSKR